MRLGYRFCCGMFGVIIVDQSDLENRPSKKVRIGLVVPSLGFCSGVPSVAEFICRKIERRRGCPMRRHMHAEPDLPPR